MMPDGVNVSIGTESSEISGSTISVGNVGNHSSETVSKLEARVSKIEELLGGYLGIPGLTQEMAAMKADLSEIKDEIKRTYVHPIQYIMVVVSVSALILSVIVTAFGMLK